MLSSTTIPATLLCRRIGSIPGREGKGGFGGSGSTEPGHGYSLVGRGRGVGGGTTQQSIPIGIILLYVIHYLITILLKDVE